ncbi:anthranilate synthase component II [Sporocytophaga myxococcoides]|uniref:anthranilate synthase component II n=1 Tax=Sporocytophaga myxococcoides TaxID=153721 RepID=UPI00048F48FA|nr:aminodeoxychorismate/anthranilate synthase component II [Sporocytophaga myxococcoides]
MIVLIDNLDSYTYNLLHLFQKLGVVCTCMRIDEIEDLEALNSFSGIVLSPGPGNPKDQQLLLSIIEKFWRLKPILGICLGHQAIGYFFGSEIVKMDKPMHGKISLLEVVYKDPVFENINEDFNIVRYHSLILGKLPPVLKVLAESNNNEIMAIRHITQPIYGFQFHPEAVLSENGEKLIQNWLSLSFTIK